MNVIIRSITLALFFTLAAPAWAADPGLPADYWQTPIPPQGEPPAWHALETDLRPEACGQCHSEQFKAWKQSFHAHAYSPGLAGQYPGLGLHEANNSCQTCHGPLSEQLLSTSEPWSESLLTFADKPPASSLMRQSSAAQLRRAGVSCAVCHVRGWRRFGPPPRDSGATGKVDGPAHGGFTATKQFEQSEFCAACHQFPQSYASEALNGKPLENTVFEWQQSSFSSQGVSCQNCHMPDRRHAFKGIHDAEMVRSGLLFSSATEQGKVIWNITSSRIGHAFPTYVTPRVEVRAHALDADGGKLDERLWVISRVVSSSGGWHEVSDTRLMPGETRDFAMDLPTGTDKVRFEIWVEPDYFYIGVYRQLLAGNMQPEARLRIEQALERALAARYLLRADDVTVIGSRRQD
ncbi:MAG: hypothetical protein R8K46_02490 [Mariprofundaceae bacterium]